LPASRRDIIVVGIVLTRDIQKDMTGKKRRIRRHIVITFVFVGLSSPGAAAAVDGEADLVHKRAAFAEAYPQAELGNWEAVADRQELLEDYVLWPDLRTVYLKARVNHPRFDATDESAVVAFLAEYDSLRAVRDLRYTYALKLASTGRLADYLVIYQQNYQGLAIPKLDCLALQAEIDAGHRDRVIHRAAELWMVGRSQEDECDPVFDYLRTEQLLDIEWYRERYALAIEAREFPLARYLSGPLEPRYREIATDWLAARDDPSTFLEKHADDADNPTLRQQLLYAIEQLAYQDPGTALPVWRNLRDRYAYSDEQIAATSQHVALWAARRQLPQALDALLDLPPPAIDAEVRRWTVRSSLRGQDWGRVIDSIAAMPVADQSDEQWQYWHAQALRNIMQEDHALSILNQLSGTRSYYGFLASDDIGIDYTFGHIPVNADGDVLATLADDPALIRARELFMVGQDSKGRAEWDAFVANLSAHEKIQAALLAHRWGWHSRAISAVASAGQYDDLDIRYPLPYQESFAQYSSDAGIAPSWAYGVARSESLFMSDVRSGAGAVGIMQVMPDTGRMTARAIGVPYSGVGTLVDPPSNIRLGTTYLGKLLDRFDRNPILATAAYNAGPIAVASWLPVIDEIDARIWIENIPYNETRDYVRRVLATEVIFHWRMTGEARRISSGLAPVQATRSPDRVAKSD
jgi:soluble lytic murein transglycosylase